VLNILSYGDHTSGEIHGAATRSYYQKMTRNTEPFCFTDTSYVAAGHAETQLFACSLRFSDE